jgi:hypothetical protein
MLACDIDEFSGTHVISVGPVLSLASFIPFPLNAHLAETAFSDLFSMI